MFKKSLTFLIVLFVCMASSLAAKPIYKAQKVFQTKGIIWSIEFINENELLATTKDGRLIRYNLKTKKEENLTGLPESKVHGQGGLLDLMLHPEFAKNQKVYFSYTKEVEGGFTTAIASGFLKEKQIAELKDIFVANKPSRKGQHFGSRLETDGEYLFFTVGDRGQRELAQDLSADQGKVHRLSLEGETPKSNPFYQNNKARKTIWSYGHRNPQGLKYDPVEKILYEQEHGPKGGDEINIILQGKNFGWPKATYGKEYSGRTITDKPVLKGIESPLYYYIPSIAPSGLELYRGEKIPQFNNKLISGALVLTHLNVLDISNKNKIKELRLFEQGKERIRDVKQSPDGFLYFSTDSGKIFKVYL